MPIPPFLWSSRCKKPKHVQITVQVIFETLLFNKGRSADLPYYWELHIHVNINVLKRTSVLIFLIFLKVEPWVWTCIYFRGFTLRRKYVFSIKRNIYMYIIYTRGVQIWMQLGQYFAFNNVLHELKMYMYRIDGYEIDTINVQISSV
jgi:hypothetical protein